MDDIEALFSTSGVSREQLRFIPDQHGGSVGVSCARGETRVWFCIPSREADGVRA